ncbi:AsmA family protein [Marinimicrococcus flavescens]|uniref:AsmA family protein n=1 Tax=Marinimicrococcus flavescens TaxID=3031815 RepID=A0AAP3XQY6_9PROT|nr:AsmA family protein [Marinimicrococcus flavescens]
MRLRKTLLVLAILLVTVPALLLAAVALVDLERYRPYLEARASEALGREVTVGGEIGLAFSLRPTVALGNVTLANATWGTRPEMARVRRLAVRLALLPLLRGEADIASIAIEGADIVLETDAQGRGNWSPVKPSGEAGARAPQSTDAAGRGAAGEGDGPATLPLVRSLRIVDSVLSWRDGRSGALLAVAVDRLEAETGGLDQPIGLEARGTINGRRVELEGELGPLAALVTGDEPWPVRLDGEALDADVTIAGTVLRPLQPERLDLKVSVETRRPERLLAIDASLGVSPQLLDALERVRLAGRVAGPAGGPALEELDATARFAGLDIAAEGRIGDVARLEGLALDIRAEGQDNGALAQLLGRRLPEGKVALAVRAEGNAGRLALPGLRLGLGTNELVGGLLLRREGPRPRIEGELNAPRLDLAAFAGEKGVAGRSGSGGSGTKDRRERLFSKEPLDLGALGLVDLDLELSAGELRLPGLLLEMAAARLLLEERRLELAPMKLHLAGNAAGGRLVLDARKGPPALQLELDAPGIDMAALLAAFGREDLVESKGRLKLRLAGAGASPAALAGSLDGELEAVLAAGRLRVGVLDGLEGGRRIAAALFGDPRGWVDLRCGRFEIPVADGVARLRTAVLETSVSRVLASGSIDLGRERLDLLLTPRSRVGGLDLALPVKLKGTLMEPDPGIDESEAARRAAAALLGGLLGLQGGQAGDVCGEVLPEGDGAAPREPPAGSGAGRADPAVDGARDAADRLRRGLEGLLGGRR